MEGTAVVLGGTHVVLRVVVGDKSKSGPQAERGLSVSQAAGLNVLSAYGTSTFPCLPSAAVVQEPWRPVYGRSGNAVVSTSLPHTWDYNHTRLSHQKHLCSPSRDSEFLQPIAGKTVTA
jgi:hypothetical protein